ncbi:MAG: SpoIIE family protein phosphatase [Bacteroidia bacterium]|nr:SpoIIE family protein phosphatase [Bacteroidia bacterium]
MYTPSEILSQLHYRIRASLKQRDSRNSDGMDLSLCRIQTQPDGLIHLEFSGAKSSFYFYTSGELHELRGDRKSVGGWQREVERTFTNHSLKLVPDDTLYFFTDGYIDASSPDRKKLGYKKLKEVLHIHQSGSLKEQGAALLETLYQHQGSSEQRDDITLLGVKL